jgi:hypothetical protein
MKRFLLVAAIVVAALLVLSAPHARAEPAARGNSGRNTPTAERHREYKASENFGYSKHGHKTISWTHSHWSDYYHRYCYWAPNHGWCFYEPTYSCYLPVSSFFEVYPEAVRAYAPPVSPASTVTQQTTVVTAPSTPAAARPEPPPIPIVAPPPAAVQNTKVGAGAP